MVKRYYIDLESAQYGGNFKKFELMIEDADGEFVTHDDYAAILARAEAAEKEREELKDEYETRADGQRVRKDRWETGFRNIASILGMARKEFEIPEIVELVRGLVDERDRMREALEGMLMVSTSQRTTIEEQADAIAIARAALNGGKND